MKNQIIIYKSKIKSYTLIQINHNLPGRIKTKHLTKTLNYYRKLNYQIYQN